MSIERLQLLIKGQVQGVGFRPHVYHLAQLLKLTGFVQNNAEGVFIQIQGVDPDNFLVQLLISLPSLARIDGVEIQKVSLLNNELNFQILESKAEQSHAIIPPDTSICNACLHELFDPQSRYYQYPFLNCQHCGPRLTITKNLPYDRYQTSMDVFAFCAQCRDDYTNPANRRYHAQPTACAECGPTLSSSIECIVSAILDGKIVALKGLGGYQLLCDAGNEDALELLRKRKQREKKPFALMFLNHQSIVNLVELDAVAQQLLSSRARPIVLLKMRSSILPKLIAPNLSHLGIMLPSTPLHYLIFHALAGYPCSQQWLDNILPISLVVTSANLSGSPLIIDDIVAHDELGSIADLIVSYNRQIVTRVDDSVLQIINNRPAFIRRARGFAPERIKLAYSMPATLALGCDLKNTFCITRDDEAFVSQHIGNLTHSKTIEFLHESLDYWKRFLGVNIERIACDSHPDFYTMQLAQTYNLELVTVQHHHAHLASVAAEHHLLEPALGLALDGYGYGSDGDAWGGELLLFDNVNFQRLGCLLPIPQPGGDIAAREPWRMGASILHLLGLNNQIVKRFGSEYQADRLASLFNTKYPMPLTSSCGRLFDAASSLLGINLVSFYEGQAAMQLESLVTALEVLPNGWSVDEGKLNLLPLFMQLLDMNPVSGANIFHGTLIAALTDWIVLATGSVVPLKDGVFSELSTNNKIVLSGGCFSNKVLADGLRSSLVTHGFNVYLPKNLPPNDGGLSLGQAFIAGTKEFTVNDCI